MEAAGAAGWTVLALWPPGRRGGQKREQYLVGFGEIEGALQGRPADRSSSAATSSSGPAAAKVRNSLSLSNSHHCNHYR